MRRGIIFVIVSVATLASCANRKPTALVVAVNSEIPVPDGIEELDLKVTSSDSKFSQTYHLGPKGDTKLPGTINVVRPDDKDSVGPVTISVTAHLQDGSNKVVRSATTGFSDEKQLLLRLPLRFSCLDFAGTCADDETCKAGKCEKNDVHVESLPEFSEDQVFPTAGNCFDRAACVATASTVEVTELFQMNGSTNCEFTLSDLKATAPDMKVSPTSLNFGFVWAKNTTGKWTAVDFDPEEGWQFADEARTIIHLTPGLCDIVAGRVVDDDGHSLVKKAIMNPTCAPKLPTQPECAPPPAAATGTGGSGGAPAK